VRVREDVLGRTDRGNSLQDAGVPGLARPVLPEQDGQVGAEFQALVGGEGVDVLDLLQAGQLQGLVLCDLDFVENEHGHLWLRLLGQSLLGQERGVDLLDDVLTGFLSRQDGLGHQPPDPRILFVGPVHEQAPGRRVPEVYGNGVVGQHGLRSWRTV
jgi:hypothetical protein